MPITVSHPIHTYTELQQQIHDDLRIQHPEWVKPNGDWTVGKGLGIGKRVLSDTLFAALRLASDTLI